MDYRTCTASFQIQERDLALLRGLFESRVMSVFHVSVLYFAKRSEAAKKRLQKIKAAGLVGERPRRPFEPSVIFLTSLGFTFLHESGRLQGYPCIPVPALKRRSQVSDATLRHELDVMDVKTAVYSAASKAALLSIQEFITWPMLIQFESRNAVVKPDGFVRLVETKPDSAPTEDCYFLELDRSTESQSILISKAAAYIDYYRAGGFAERRGAPRSAYRRYPFRVLFIFLSTERRDNFARRLLANGTGLRQFWLSTVNDVKRAPLGKIWTRPIDYLRSTARTLAFHTLLTGSRPSG